MALPTPVFPASLFNGNEQSIAKDDPGNPVKANGGDYNTATVEIKEIEKFLRFGYLRKFINRTGSQLDKGTLVFISGRDGTAGLPKVTKAQADLVTRLAEYVVLEDTANDAEGNMANGLVVSGINTAGFTVNSLVFLSTTPGAMQDDAAVIAQPVGRVVIVGASGEVEFLIRAPMFVNNYPQLKDITFGTQSGDSIKISYQVQDAFGNNLAGERLVEVWIGDASKGSPRTVDISLAFSKGNLIKIVTPEAYLRGQTDANGELELDAQHTAGNKFAMGQVGGSPVKASTVITWT